MKCKVYDSATDLLEYASFNFNGALGKPIIGSPYDAVKISSNTSFFHRTSGI